MEFFWTNNFKILMGQNGPMISSEESGGISNNYTISEALAIPLPANLEHFGQIRVEYFDTNVLMFLNRISGLFKQELVVQLRINSNNADVIGNLWALLQDNIWGLVIDDARSLALLRKHISPSVLCDCPNLCKIKTTGLVPEMPNSDDANASDRQALSKWLHRAQSGRPMAFKCATNLLGDEDDFSTDGLEEAFRQATTIPSIYILDFGELTPAEEIIGRFPMHNSIGEQLNLIDEDGDSMFYTLERGPADDRIGTVGEWNPGDLEDAEYNFLSLDIDVARMGQFAQL
uniref:FBA_2 domain-containing protein n=1 Tax=Globodera pallida TaxID=36090 RepID=A0A183BSA7_GLOPA